MKIDWKNVAKSIGYKQLKKDVLRDCVKEKNCFNTTGCPKDKPCFHKYCDIFKWTIDKAKHFAHMYRVSGITVRRILNLWESYRNYWYVNWYQDCNLRRLETYIIAYLKEEHLDPVIHRLKGVVPKAE